MVFEVSRGAVLVGHLHLHDAFELSSGDNHGNDQRKSGKEGAKFHGGE
jgi:hypothetical protein